MLAFVAFTKWILSEQTARVWTVCRVPYRDLVNMIIRYLIAKKNAWSFFTDFFCILNYTFSNIDRIAILKIAI
jgi:hypothetical protein